MHIFSKFREIESQRNLNIMMTLMIEVVKTFIDEEVEEPTPEDLEMIDDIIDEYLLLMINNIVNNNQTLKNQTQNLI